MYVCNGMEWYGTGWYVSMYPCIYVDACFPMVHGLKFSFPFALQHSSHFPTVPCSWFLLVCMMVLVTFRLIGLAHLHSLWGCLAFVGFPSGFGLVGLGLCRWFPFCGVGLLFAGLFAPLVWPGRLESFVPVGPLALVFMACFRGGLLLLLLLWLPLALRCLFGGSSDQSSHAPSHWNEVFCQSAIDSAQSDHDAVLQSILANKQAHIEKIRYLRPGWRGLGLGSGIAKLGDGL